MKQKMKKIWSLMLTLILAAGMLPAMSTSVEAADDYPSNLKSADLDALVDPWNFYNRECTSFVAWCLNSRNGVAFTNWYGGVRWGHAKNWGNAARSIGITVNSSPAVGSVAWSNSGTYGHVAWVSAVNGNSVTIEEYNYSRAGAYGTRTVNASSFQYIHIKDMPTTPPAPIGTEMTSGYDRTLPDGDYIIANAGTTDKSSFCYLDIAGVEMPAANGTNVLLSGPLSDPPSVDIWTLTYSGGFYTITQKGTNMALDVHNASREQGANVKVWPSASNSAQKWAISSNGRNGYRLQAKVSGFSLDVEGGGTTSGTNVWQYSNNDSDAQSWFFIPYKPAQPVANGRYILLSAADTGYELDVVGDTGDIAHNTNVRMWADTALSRFNSFDVVALDNGYYKLIHAASGKALDVANAVSTNNANVAVCTANGSLAQQWAITKNGSGYVLRARCSGLALDASGIKDGANVYQHYYHGKANQTWQFVPAEYSVKYIVNNGTNAPAPQIKYYKNSLTLSADKPSRDGDTFLGWTKTPNGKTVDYLPGARYDQDADLTLYPVWEKDREYTVRYDFVSFIEDDEKEYFNQIKDIQDSFKPQYKSHDKPLVLHAEVPSSPCFRFLGWSKKMTNGTVDYRPGDIYNENADLDLYPVLEDLHKHKWEEWHIDVEHSYKSRRCEICDSDETMDISEHIHALVHTAATAATCTEEGNHEYWHCDDCKEYFSDSAGENEITLASTITAALGHHYSEGECTRCGEKDPNYEEPTPPAPDGAAITVATVSGKAGQTVEIPVVISKNPGIVGLSFDVSYDADAMTLTEVRDGGILGTAYHNAEELDKNPYRLSWGSYTATSNITENGTAVTLVFMLNSDVSDGKYPITISYDEIADAIYDIDFNAVDFATVPGGVTVTSFVIGDVNRDGNVTSIDTAYLARYLAGWSAYKEEGKVDLAAADVNGDGNVTSVDTAVLARHLAGWSAYAVLPYKK